MGLEEANEPKGARRGRSSKPMGSMRYIKVRMRYIKVRMGHSKPEVMQVKKVRG